MKNFMGLPHNVILVGFMGSGKTAVGKELASALKYRFWDMDKWVEKKNGKSIPEIFEKKGEEFFRAEEKKALEWFNSKEKYVVSTGGGSWISPENRDWFLKKGWCVWLKVNAEQSLKRIGKNLRQRPLLSRTEKPAELVEKMLAERDPIYSLAHSRFDTNEKNPKKIALEMKKFIEEEHPFDLFSMQK